jgi:hypothetical protein
MKKDWGMQMLSLPLQASLTVGGLTVVFGGGAMTDICAENF